MISADLLIKSSILSYLYLYKLIYIYIYILHINFYKYLKINMYIDKMSFEIYLCQ